MTEAGTEKQVDELSKRVDDLRTEMHRGIDRVEGDIRELRAETRAGFEAVDRRFDFVDERFESVNQRFDSINRRFDSISDRFDSLHRVMIGYLATTLGSIVAAAIVTILAHS